MVYRIRFTVEIDTLHPMDETEAVSFKATAIKAVNLDVRWNVRQKTVVFEEDAREYDF